MINQRSKSILKNATLSTVTRKLSHVSEMCRGKMLTRKIRASNLVVIFKGKQRTTLAKRSVVISFVYLNM